MHPRYPVSVSCSKQVVRISFGVRNFRTFFLFKTVLVVRNRANARFKWFFFRWTTRVQRNTWKTKISYTTYLSPYKYIYIYIYSVLRCVSQYMYKGWIERTYTFIFTSFSQWCSNIFDRRIKVEGAQAFSWPLYLIMRTNRATRARERRRNSPVRHKVYFLLLHRCSFCAYHGRENYVWKRALLHIVHVHEWKKRRWYLRGMRRAVL